MLSIRSLARQLWGRLAAGQRRPPSPPRPPSTASFETLDSSKPIEEERLPWYDPDDFYPVRIGEVFKSRYQVVAKLGYGAYSTAWLCRDLVEHRHVTVKVCTRNSVPVKRELAAVKYLNSLPKTRHPGQQCVRTLLDQFELTYEHAVMPSQSNDRALDTRPFQCLVHKPMLMSIFAFRMDLHRVGMTYEVPLLKLFLHEILVALDYLHTEAKIVHTDVQERNILLGLDDAATLEAFEEEEYAHPSPRKVTDDRSIYLSRKITTSGKHYGRPVICDLGEARFGSKTYTGMIQPDQYRAPEVILGMPWNEKVDIWSLGVMIWNMLDDKDMFNPRGPNNGEDNVYHLAHMVSLLGPPPVDFLKRSETDEPWKYFNAQGNWIGAISLPDDSLEKSEQILQEEDKAQLLEFVRKLVTWKPEDRPSTRELLSDEWIRNR